MRRPPPPRSPRWCWPAAWPSTAPACSPRPTPGGIVTEDSPILPDDEYGLSKWTAYQAAGEPALLTVGIIAANGAPLVVPPPPKGTIWVVEGVSALVAAAARRVPVPVVCRGGTPSVAVTRLVSAAAVAGWEIAVSSDFEPRGLHGAASLLRLVAPSGRPWRLSADDYLAATTEGEPFLPEQVPYTPWDPELAAAMRQRRQRVSEEARLKELLAHLELHRNGNNGG